MDFPNLCRTCLSTQHLMPIFKDNDDCESYLASLCNTTGLIIEKNDGLPQVMCKSCTTFLQAVTNFMTVCKQAETQLLQMKENINKEVKLIDNVKNKHTQYKAKKRKTTKAELKNCQKDKKSLKNIVLTELNKSECNNVIIEAKELKIDIQELHEKVLICEKEKNICQDVFVSNTYNSNNEKLQCVNYFDEDLNKNYNKQLKPDKNENNDTRLISEQISVDIIEKSNLDIDESEYETEFLDISFDSDSKTWVFKEDPCLDNHFYENSLKNIKHQTKAKMKETHINDRPMNETDRKLIESDMKINNSVTKNTILMKEVNNSQIKTVNESDTNTIDSDMKIIYSNTLNYISKKEMNNSGTDISLLNKKEQIDSSITELIAQNDVKNGQNINKKSNNLENRLFEVVGKKVICKICLKEMSRRSIVQHVISRHPGADGRRTKCEYCDAYILRERMLAHRNKMHGDRFRCMYCHNEYLKGEDLKEHVPKCTHKKRQKKGKEAMVECDICNKTMQKSSLKTHKDVKHAGMGPVCEHCGRRLGNKLRLLEHLRSRHGHDKFKCSACDFRTASHTALTNHERRHRGEKPYVCEQCGAKFHAAYLLTQHKHSHRTHKDVKCEQCPAAFKTTNSLHSHRMSCHNNTLYQCEVCPRVFKCRRYLMKHVAGVHSTAPAPALTAA